MNECDAGVYVQKKKRDDAKRWVNQLQAVVNVRHIRRPPQHPAVRTEEAWTTCRPARVTAAERNKRQKSFHISKAWLERTTLNMGFIADFGATPGLGGCPYGLCNNDPLNSDVFPFMGDERGCRGECCGYGKPRPSGWGCSQGDCEGESEGESERVCIGGGDILPVSGPSGSGENDDRVDGEMSCPNSSNDV